MNNRGRPEVEYRGCAFELRKEKEVNGAELNSDGMRAGPSDQSQSVAAPSVTATPLDQ